MEIEDGRVNLALILLWLMPGYSSGVSVRETQLAERAIAIQISVSQLQAILYEAFLTVTPF